MNNECKQHGEPLVLKIPFFFMQQSCFAFSFKGSEGRRLANALAKKPSTSVRDIEDTLTGPKVCCTLRIPTSYIIDTCIRVTIYFLWLH